MEMILNGVNGRYLRSIVENAAEHTESVSAAVAYATDASLLFDWCWTNNIPLRFWCRYDEGVPVRTEILRRFLERRSPNYVCKLLPSFHPKVIWWRGYGAYIGSANLTGSAWWSNIEAGVFIPEAELATTGHAADLEAMFRLIDQHASPLTQELYEAIVRREERLRRISSEDRDDADRFIKSPYIKPFSGLAQVTRSAAQDARKTAFLAEWNATIQTIRDLAVRVAENRPGWVSADAPLGAQADQFLHAHYYQRTFEARRAMYEQHFERNRHDPEAATVETLAWWQALPSPPNSEDVTLNDWAPFLRGMLAADRIGSLSENDLVEVFMRVHSIRDHARRVANKVVGLPDNGVQYSIDEKTFALAKHVYRSRTQTGGTVLQTIEYVLYGGLSEQLPERLWDAVTRPEFGIDHFGISALGELVGWALPDQFPPRNGRTSKALRSLGHPVQVHV